jgi:hypothetical protein
MVWMLLAATSAEAGIVIGLDGGTAVPLEAKDTDAQTGAAFSAHAGYRFSFGIVHVRPELAARWNLGGKVGQGALGVVGTFGAGAAFGPYAHVGIPIDGDFGPTSDAGLIFEIGVPALPLLFHARAGWQLDRLDAGGSSDWFVAAIGVSVDL